MIHHCSVGVIDLERAGAFYDQVLGALGYIRTAEGASFIGYGVEPGIDPFYIAQTDRAAPAGPRSHIAFTAPSRAAVKNAFAAALHFGGTDNGAPGIRDRYGPDYFAAYVADVDGNQIEFVHNAPG